MHPPQAPTAGSPAARLGARTALITRDAVGGMAATDGPVPVRVLAHAARLLREARQLDTFGIEVGETALDYGRLLEWSRRGKTSTMLPQLREGGVVVFDHCGTAGFVDPHTIAADNGGRREIRHRSTRSLSGFHQYDKPTWRSSHPPPVVP